MLYNHWLYVRYSRHGGTFQPLVETAGIDFFYLITMTESHVETELFNCTWWMHCRWMPCPLFVLCLPQPCIKSLMIVGLVAVTTNCSPGVVFHTGPRLHLWPENPLKVIIFVVDVGQLIWCTLFLKYCISDYASVSTNHIFKPCYCGLGVWVLFQPFHMSIGFHSISYGMKIQV